MLALQGMDEAQAVQDLGLHHGLAGPPQSVHGGFQYGQGFGRLAVVGQFHGRTALPGCHDGRMGAFGALGEEGCHAVSSPDYKAIPIW